MSRFTTTGGSGSGTQGPQGPQGPAGENGTNGADALWNFEGEWVNGVDYAPGSVVQFEGSSYYHPNGQFSSYAPPGNGWLLISAKGDAGENGNDGAPGATGSQGLYYLGNYVSGNGYVANLAVVKGSDNNLYIATSSGGLGDPVGNSAEWNIFLPKGVDGEDAVLPQDLGTTDNPTFSKITLTSNGAIDNIAIGDDVLLGDGNIANHLVIVGNQDPTQGGVVLGNNKTEQISSDGSNLTLESDNDIILYPGSSYAYVGTPTLGGETRIATVGDLPTGATGTFTSQDNKTVTVTNGIITSIV